MTTTTPGPPVAGEADLESAAAATNTHYDLPPRIFECFLGSRMKYTCGLYPAPDATLDEAQETKLGFIADRLAIKGGERVLDIGAGWGALALYLAQRHGCHVVGITPSAVQAAYAGSRARAAGLQDHVELRRCSVYDLRRDGSFDAVAMVGVIEHMPDHHRALATAAGMLGRGGRLYLSASCYRSQEHFARYAARPASRHVADEIFGYATLRPFSGLIAAAEDAGLSLSGITDLTPHYHRTVQDWLAAVTARRAEIDGLRPGLSEQLIRYLETTNAGWGRTTKHYALTAVRSRWGVTEVPR